MRNFKIKEDEQGQRIDIYLSKKMTDYSRAFIQKLLIDNVNVNDHVVRSSYRLRRDDKISVNIDALDHEVKPLELKILYEDSDCLVIDKPAGILSHSKGNTNEEATVETFIADKVSGFDGPRAGIVHRLDRQTSGVMICAKHPEAYRWLQKQFSTRKVNKDYIAIVCGQMKENEAIIDMPIGRNPKAPATFRVHSNGKNASTAYKVLKSSRHYSLLKLSPRTGRTHQLRVHLSHLNHPILGDTLYKGLVADRLYLHAEKLELKLPNLNLAIFEVKAPLEFNKVIENDHE